jgi:hypothetical protein
MKQPRPFKPQGMYLLVALTVFFSFWKIFGMPPGYRGDWADGFDDIVRRTRTDNGGHSSHRRPVDSTDSTISPERRGRSEIIRPKA